MLGGGFVLGLLVVGGVADELGGAAPEDVIVINLGGQLAAVPCAPEGVAGYELGGVPGGVFGDVFEDVFGGELGNEFGDALEDVFEDDFVGEFGFEVEDVVVGEGFVVVTEEEPGVGDEAVVVFQSISCHLLS